MSAETAGGGGFAVPGALAANQGPEGVGAPKAASEGPLDVRQLVYNKLTGAGLQPHQAVGAIWSLNGESRGLNPGAYNPKDPGGSVGFGQWMGPRRAALEAFAKARGTAVTDPTTQADFLVDELTNPKAATYQPGVLSAMQGAKTAEDATRVWTAKFERPKIDNSDQRIKAGPQAAMLDSNGAFALGPGVGSNAPPSVAAAPAVAGVPAASPTDDRPWYAKAFGAVMEGKDGKQSPFDKFSEALAGGKKAAQAPEKSALSGQGPGARNVSPGLQNVAQVYGQTLNSFSQPLTWNDAPPRIPVAPAGFQPSQIPGISLNSVQPSSQGLGYGIEPVGYGYG